MVAPTKIDVLDHGFVELINSMGDDYTILQAARVSTGGVAKKGDKQDRGLIRYLYINKHLTPFEQVVFTFHIKAPILVLRQLMRHRTFSFNEYSARYSEMIKDVYIPDIFRKQGEKNHQGSGEEFEENINEMYRDIYSETVDDLYVTYENMLEDGIAREQARGILPVAQYSEIYATVDLRNLLHFLSLRLHEHAQQEIRVFAQAMYDLIKTKDELKWTLEVFEETMKLDWAFLDALNAARKKKNGIEDLINILENFQKEEKE